MTALQTNSRIPGLDLIRVAACYLVLQVHAGEFYYIGEAVGDKWLVAEGIGPWIGGWINSLGRASVPLFVMLSGFLLLPLRTGPREFLRRRFRRVAIPFVVWCVLYALYYALRGTATAEETLLAICRIPVNYGVEVGHLWYIYMLLGLYLFAPVISPWIASASRRAMEGFLGLWAVTLCLPYLHLLFPAWWGEAYWNHTPMLHYFSGFLGYLVLGAYLRRHFAEPRARDRWFGAALLVAGYAATVFGFSARLSTPYVDALELAWGFETINVAAMAAGLFLLLKDVRLGTGRTARLVGSLSNYSYGIYLAHIMVLNGFFALLNGAIENIAVKIPLMAIGTFVVTALLVRLVSLLPRSKYLIG